MKFGLYLDSGFDVLGCVSMDNKSKSKDFIAGFDKIWQTGPEVKYQNPDNWNH
jgi:hypothetical protein